MAESQRGGERDIDIESRRELNAVADNSAVSERIVALKKSKAGHLGELKKIYRRLDEYLLLQGSTIVTHCFTISLNVS